MSEGKSQTRFPCFWLETTVWLNEMGKTREEVESGFTADYQLILSQFAPLARLRIIETPGTKARRSSLEMRAVTLSPPLALPDPL